MDIKKKAVIFSAAAVAVIGTGYSVYLFMGQKSPEEQPAPAHAPAAGPGIDSSQFLFDGGAGGALTASGKAMTADDPAGSVNSAGGPGVIGDDSIASSTGPAGPAAPKVGSPGRSPGSGGAGTLEQREWLAGRQGGSHDGASFGSGGQGRAGASPGSASKKAKAGKKGSAPEFPSGGTVAGLPAELFTGKMTDAQSDDLLKRFNMGKLTAMHEDALIALVNDGMKFTEKQAQVLQAMRARDDKKIEAEMARAEQTPVQFPPDMQVQRGRHWPCRGRVSQKFGCVNWNVYSGRYYNGVWCPHFHNGLDIAAPLNTPLHAFDAGKVTAVGGTQSSGVYVTIAHPDGLATTYFHMPVGGPRVSVGQFVNANQVVGSIGMTGMTTGPHVHFIVRKGDVIDPLSVLP